MTLRYNLSLLSQTEEREWRENLLSQPACRQKFNKIVSLMDKNLCLFAFAVIAGGPNYERTCWSSLRSISQSRHDLDARLSTTEKHEISRLIQPPSTQESSLQSYLTQLIFLIGENDPCTGNLVLQGTKFGDIFSIYQCDSRASNDVPKFASRTAVAKVWQKVVAEHHVCLQQGRTLGKCSICISFKSRLMQVSIFIID